MMKYTLILLGLLFCVPTAIFTQEIYLQNASFEDKIAQNVIPTSWLDCGVSERLRPDIESWEVKRYLRRNQPIHLPDAIEGATYLSLYTDMSRNSSAIGQELSAPLEAGKCYFFNIYACFVLTPKPHSDVKRPKDFEPLQLQIWGSNSLEERGELLAESLVIRSFGWAKEKFILEPLQNWKYFILTVSSEEISNEPVDGKILLDNASPIIGVNCETVDFETGELISDEYDPQYNYPEYLQHFLSDNWDRPLFEKEGTELTLGAELLFEEIAQTTAEAQYYRIYFAIKDHNDLGNARVATLKNLLKSAGLKGRFFHTQTIMTSDYKKEWLAKNGEVWVRIVVI
ncbi:MAG: hypothetical protein ACI9XO_001030 [Paraglaciecola sp.]|jgi:hypothetical protein